MKKVPQVWRQGDVFLVAVGEFPAGRRESHSLVLATGHSHRVEDGEASAAMIGDKLFLEVGGTGAILRHDEHAPITIPCGRYEIRIQREYAPNEIRRVVD